MSNNSKDLIKEITPVSIETEMKRSYLDYAMSVIVSRALPDARDGLKPVHRRILYAMYEGGYDFNKPFKKSARIVGEVMGKYHPHGDSAIYDSLVRMAQDFSMRTVLIDGQGNFGSIDDDPPAAMRYTESRLAKISHSILEDLDKETVDFMPNYDGAEKEPKVLPASYPNLLVNGSSGIAVGMATNIPPHNLSEIVSATITLIDNPETTDEELLQIIPGPDFPTGGVILGRSGYVSALKTGRGSIILRGKCEIKEVGKKSSIIIHEVPYQVNKAKMVEKIAELTRDKKITGISELRDESDREGVRIVIDLKKDAIAEVVLNQLYNFTQLQISFPMNMLALNKGRPQTMTVRNVLDLFIEFRYEILTRRTNFLLSKARNKAHIFIGLWVAVSNIDEIVRLIRSSKDTTEAKIKLMSQSWDASEVINLINLVRDRGNIVNDGKFYFTEEQAKAILDMRLAKLTGLEKDKIDEELKLLSNIIAEYLEILSNREKMTSIIKNDLHEIKEKFGDNRKTAIEENEFESSIEDLIPKEDMLVSVTVNGYIKRVPLSTYKSQNRGGKGRSGMSVNDEDFATQIFIANTHVPILFFSNKGMVYRLKTYKLPLSSPQSKGRAMVNLLPLDANEKITTILPLLENTKEWQKLNIILATKTGHVRRNAMDDFRLISAGGKIAMKLPDDDALIGAHLCKDEDDVLIVTKKGKTVRFSVSNLRVFKSRNSIGVRGVKLFGKDDRAISSCVLDTVKVSSEIRDNYLKIPVDKRLALKKELLSLAAENNLLSMTEPQIKIDSDLDKKTIYNLAKNEKFLLSVTEKGYGKRSSVYEYRISNRGGVGVVNMAISSKNGDVVSCMPVEDDDQIIIISDKGTMIRTPVKNVRITGRNSSGVILLRLKDKDEKVASVARAEKDNENEEDINKLL